MIERPNEGRLADHRLPVELSSKPARTLELTVPEAVRPPPEPGEVHEELKAIWQTGEPFDPQPISQVLGLEAESLPPTGLARAAVYRWTFPEALHGEAPQWFKRIDMVTRYNELRVLSYGLPRPELLRDSPFQDPWDTELHIESIATGADQDGPTLVVSLAYSPGERLYIHLDGSFVYEARTLIEQHSSQEIPSGD